MKDKFRLLLLQTLALALPFVIAACSGSDDDSTPDTPTPPVTERTTHGIVFYLMGSGTGLESFMDENVRRVVETATRLVSDSNKIAIFYDRGTSTQLMEVKKIDGRTVKVVAKEWNPSATSSADPEFMANALKEARQLLGTDTYGLVVSSHGGGWVPSGIFDLYLTDTRQTRFIGQDGNDYMETPQMARAMEAAGKWDYLLFDACFMSSVEALYDFRHAADYIVASPSEVLGAGFPYPQVLPLLFTPGHSLAGVCQAYMESYKNSSATIALVRTDKLDALAMAMKGVLANGGTADPSQLQGYEGFQPHLYFDLRQYAHALATDTRAFDQALAEAVVYAAHTPTIYTDYGPLKGNITMDECCGVTCHVKTDKFPATHAAFREREGQRAVGGRKKSGRRAKKRGVGVKKHTPPAVWMKSAAMWPVTREKDYLTVYVLPFTVGRSYS